MSCWQGERASWRWCVGIISLCRKVGDQVASHWPEVWTLL